MLDMMLTTCGAKRSGTADEPVEMYWKAVATEYPRYWVAIAVLAS